jgi:putative PIN family toxin of toxin-antitoxin system
VKVVLDTNVLVSGLMYPDGVPGKIVIAWREAQFDIVSSLRQLEEIGRVLSYPKIQKVLKWSAKTIERFLEQLLLRVELAELEEFEDAELRDASDSPILASLVASDADFLVTGDGDLLALRERFSILTPAEFSEKL